MAQVYLCFYCCCLSLPMNNPRALFLRISLYILISIIKPHTSCSFCSVCLAIILRTQSPTPAFYTNNNYSCNARMRVSLLNISI